jgi:urease accessory protein
MPVILCFAGFTPNAHAHLAVKGLGEVGNGALHPFITPAHALIILALGLLLGQRKPFELKHPVAMMAPVSAGALVLTTTGWFPGVYQPLLVAVALCCAVFVVIGRQFPASVYGSLCVVGVLGIGLDSAAEDGTAFAVAKTLIGTWISLNLVIPYIAICASNGADKPWAATAIRILGSWIVAISLMVLAFALRK